MRLVYLTSGAAGMFCGSCMHDNTLAKALVQSGVDVILAPTYTPIRTDEDDISIDRVFFGGISIYLQQKAPLLRHLPSFLDRFLDQPWLIRMVTARAAETNPRDLGALTVSMLQGKMGRQQKEVRKLCDWLKSDAKPDALLLSNMLIAGAVPAIKEILDIPVLVTLQGDDIFLNDLPEPYRSDAIGELQKLAPSVDRFVTHSRYYADFMADLLSLPREKIEVTPLGIDASEFADVSRKSGEPPTVGYLARLAPEKGLHNLVDAFIQMHQRLQQSDCRLLLAGWLGKHNEPYVNEQFERLKAAGLEDRFEYVGSVTLEEKRDFLSRIDLLSVPTDYREPKGLYVLEALASGVPVVQPSHGAFPELIEHLQGGRLYPPGQNDQLADQLAELLADESQRLALGRTGREIAQSHYNAQCMSQQTLELIQRSLPS